MNPSQTLYTYYKAWGNNILFRYRKNGKSYAKKVDFFRPSVYMRADDGTNDATSIYGHPLKAIQFDGLRDARAFCRQYDDVAGFEIEGNSDFANQFIIELYQGKMPEFDPNGIRVGILDIEVNVPDDGGFPRPDETKFPINGVTIYDNFTDTYYVFSDKPYTHNPDADVVGGLKIDFTLCEGEAGILQAMLRHFKEFQYDLTSGWNSETFDMPYIVNRCYKIVGEGFTKDCMSPFGIIDVREIRGNFGSAQLKADTFGMPHCDFMALYDKHNFTPRESMRLDHIAQEELGVGKMTYEEAGSLSALYENDPQRFIEYNIRDVYLVKAMNDKLGFLNVTYTLAYYCLANYEDTLGTTKIWEKLIAKHLYNRGNVPLFKGAGHTSNEEFDGAFVHPTQAGFVEWLVSVDLNSLYPMNEIQYGISPETHIPRHQLPAELAALKSKYTLDDLVEGKVDLSVLEKYNYTMAGNFEFYDKSKSGFMAEIKEELYAGRKTHKNNMLGAQSKIQTLKAEARRRSLIT